MHTLPLLSNIYRKKFLLVQDKKIELFCHRYCRVSCNKAVVYLTYLVKKKNFFVVII